MRDDIFTIVDGQKIYDVQKIFGRGYNNGLFFNCNARYRIFVGSRSSKKSQNMLGYEPILKILSNPLRNIIIVRQNDVDNRTSTFPQLIQCIEDLGLTKEFKITKEPMQIEYRKTGQLIIFKGMNNPTSITSTKFPHGLGAPTDIYIEEAYEVANYSDFLKLDGSARLDKKSAEQIKIQITIVMNPWTPNHWVFTEFFKGRMEPSAEYMEHHLYDDLYDPDFIGPFGRGLYIHQSNFKINEFRTSDWDASAAVMKVRSPDLYKPTYLGLWGATTGLVYREWGAHCLMDLKDMLNEPIMDFAIGIDAGLSNGEGKKVSVKRGENPAEKIRSATTMILGAISRGNNLCYGIEEYFHTNDYAGSANNTDGDRRDLTETQLYDEIIKKIIEWINKYSNGKTLLMKGQINCYVDSADTGFRQGLMMKANEYGLYNISFIKSTKKTIQTRVDFMKLMMSYGAVKINEKGCPNLIREIENARRGDKGEARAPGNDHMLDAWDYMLAPWLEQIVLWKTQFKEH